MSCATPTHPYVYQPYGVFDTYFWKTGRVYGIAGFPLDLSADVAATIKGLTKREAYETLALILEAEIEAEEVE